LLVGFKLIVLNYLLRAVSLRHARLGACSGANDDRGCVLSLHKKMCVAIDY